MTAAALALLRRFWWAPLFLALGIAIMAQHHVIQRKDAKLQHIADASKLFLERVKRAQAQALANDLAHSRAVEALRSKLTQEASNAYQEGLAARRADYDRRLRDYQAAHSGSGTANLPAVPDPARGFDGAACRNGFLCIPTEQAFALMKAADDNTDQLLRLQRWIEGQAAVPQ